MRFHHVGVAVKSIADSAGWWTDVMGFTTETEVIHDPLQKVRVQFFVKADGFRVELVEAAADDSPVLRYLGSENGGTYHTCYEVEDLEAAVDKLRAAGAFPVTRPTPAVAFNGRRIVFLLSRERQLVELVEQALPE
ncbi:MAG: VOC family protein [Deltaproteobacteria bacterium]|nr:VOC family protein [Deltaproteobacteria bacterium]